MQRHLLSWPSGAKLLNHTRLSSQARRTPPVASCDHRSPARRCPPPAAAGRRASRSAGGAFCGGAGGCLDHSPDGRGIERPSRSRCAREHGRSGARCTGLSILRDHPELGRICNVGRSRRFSCTPIDPLFAGPPLGCDSRAIVEESGWGARFSQLVADGIVAVKLPAGTPPGQRWPAEGMMAR